MQEVHEDFDDEIESESQTATPDSEPTTSTTTPTPIPTTPAPVTRVNTAPSSPSGKPRSKKPRTMPEEDARIDEALGILKDAVSKSSSLDDECGLFGQYIANKLRSYDPMTRAVVQHEINNSIFNADMKFYHQSLATSSSSNTYRSTASRSQTQSAFNNPTIGSSSSPQLLSANQHQFYGEPEGQLESYWQQ